MPAAEVTVQPGGEGHPAIVTIAGELDLAVCPAVSSALATAEAAGPAALAVDLTEVTHIDSTGLRVLLDGARRAEAQARRFIIVAPPEGPVGRILRLTLLLEHLETVSTLEAVSA